MSETKIEYLQGERESEIRAHLRSLATFVLTSIITDKCQLKDFDEWRELLIEFIIEKNYMEVEE